MEKLLLIFVLNLDDWFLVSPFLDLEWKLLQVLLYEWIVKLDANESLRAIDGVL